jgi:hypothetical protein
VDPHDYRSEPGKVALLRQLDAFAPASLTLHPTRERNGPRVRLLVSLNALQRVLPQHTQHDIGDLADIEPMHVSLYIETLQTTAAKPTVNRAGLSCIYYLR